MRYGRSGLTPLNPSVVGFVLGSLALVAFCGSALGKDGHYRASGSKGPKCAAAWRAAVAQQSAGNLSVAKRLFEACRLPACLPAVRTECGKQLAAIESQSNAASRAVVATESAPASSGGPSCGDAWRAAVEHQKVGQLNEARDLFATCMKAACAPAVRRECVKQYDQLDADIPSVVGLVTNESGEPTLDVEIKCDGRVLVSQLDGRSISVDPGVHEFAFSKDGDVFATQKVLVPQGQHNRLIAAAIPGIGGSAPADHQKSSKVAAKKQTPPAPAKVNLAVNDDASAAAGKAEDGDGAESSQSADATLVAKPESGSHWPVLTYALAGTGLVGLGGFGLLSYWGRKDADLLAPCSPACPESSATHIKHLYLGADISLGVGVAALVGSYLAYAHSRSASPKEDAATNETAFTFGVAPTAQGTMGTISGTF